MSICDKLVVLMISKNVVGLRFMFNVYFFIFRIQIMIDINYIIKVGKNNDFDLNRGYFYFSLLLIRK